MHQQDIVAGGSGVIVFMTTRPWRSHCKWKMCRDVRGGGPSITFIFALWTLAVVKLLFNLFCLFIWCILSDKTPFASKASKEVKLPPGRRWNACMSYRHACTCVLGPPCYFFSFFFFFPPFSLPYLAIQWEQSRSSSMNRFNRPHAVPGWAEVEGRQKLKAKKVEDDHWGSWPALLWRHTLSSCPQNVLLGRSSLKQRLSKVPGSSRCYAKSRNQLQNRADSVQVP